MQNVDVSIIGAGPAGAAAAISLAQRGFAVALVDKQNFPREKLCGDFINPINRPAFRELAVEKLILAQTHGEVRGFRITTDSGNQAEARLPDRHGDASFGLGMRRAALDQTLVDHAASLGVQVRLGCRVERLLRSDHGWQLTNIAGETWQAKVLIGADGRNSWVAEQLGMNRPAAMRGRSVGFQLRLQSPDAAPDTIEIHLFPGGYAGVIGLGDGELNLCLAIAKNRLPRAGVRRFLLEEGLPRNPYLKAMLARSREISQVRSAYPVHFPKRRCFGERALLVGDAARVSEPVTGEGVYFALRSGMIAAETLDGAFGHGDVSVHSLRRYAQDCDRHFRRRMAVNAIMRFAVYRPALLDPLIRLCAANRRWLDSLVGSVCAPEPLR